MAQVQRYMNYDPNPDHPKTSHHLSEKDVADSVGVCALLWVLPRDGFETVEQILVAGAVSNRPWPIVIEM